jgi:uncharacterized membrane protein
MLIYKALHILSMFTMATIFLGGEFFYSYAVWRRDVRALAWLQRTMMRTLLPIFAILVLLVGIVFGLLTAATGGFDFLDGWLIAAYLLVVAFFVNSFVLGDRLLRVARRAVEADDGKRPVEEVVADMADRSTIIFFPINAIFAAIILDMVLKPF